MSTRTPSYLWQTLLLACLLACPLTARAHFPWLVPQTEAGRTKSLEIYFGEDASPDDPSLLSRLHGMKVQQWTAGNKSVELTPNATADSLSVAIAPETPADAIFTAAHSLGVRSRGEDTFVLQYYAKTGPAAGDKAWTEAASGKELKLNIVPTIVDGKLNVTVLFDGQPVDKAEVKTSGPGVESFEGVTDENGNVVIATQAGGICSLRARHIENSAGEEDGKKFDSIRHYCTIALPLNAVKTTVVPTSTAASSKVAPLAVPVASFGAAIADGQLYVYGGHSGRSHSYSNKEQGRNLLHINLQGGNWEVGAEGPPLQGLAMVAFDGKLYRVGGFTAMNAQGEDHDLQSQDDVAMYDPATKQWTELPSLPEPRSSHDAAVLGHSLYVVGGWHLGNKDEGEKWHKTAWKLDLSDKNEKWEAVPEPPFQRRALSVAAHNGKLFVIGGMQEDGDLSRRVDIFDPQTGKWTEGPSIHGKDEKDNLAGFGNSSFATGGQLYVSTINGDLQRLSDDGSKWELVKKLPLSRFFHRMLPVDDNHLLIVGGSNMKVGKFGDVEIIDVR